MKVIPEALRAHQIWSLRFYYFDIYTEEDYIMLNVVYQNTINDIMICSHTTWSIFAGIQQLKRKI